MKIGHTGFGLLLAFATVLMFNLPALGADTLVKVDRRTLVSRADLDYNSPASRSEEGMPLGNGRTGSLLWTTPSAVHMQINRVDVHAMDDTSFSFPRADSDYGYGCGYIDINLVQAGTDVFTGPAFHQHLSIYDALMTLQGKGVSARALAWANGDALAIEIDDERLEPEPINIDLRMLRYQMQFTPASSFENKQNHTVVFHTGAHTASSVLGIENGRITLVQRFREGSFYDSSAVAIGLVGRTGRARFLNDYTVQLSAPAAKGRFTVVIASAASANPEQKSEELALKNLDSATRAGFLAVRAQTADWWKNFWSEGMVYMHSDSGQADFLEENYTYYLYVMGATSRGDYPPRFGGMLWYTDGDMSRWGSQYWWANTSAYYVN
jgi:hypothetical protein